ncbi:hypothetical protein AA0313_2808 [Acetobacter indonesiensis NRIC 0313]|nr:hypothetical protein AA0313_2808 [Acetobacter indonesiensis NRIC 0313]
MFGFNDEYAKRRQRDMINLRRVSRSGWQHNIMETGETTFSKNVLDVRLTFAPLNVRFESFQE